MELCRLPTVDFSSTSVACALRLHHYVCVRVCVCNRLVCVRARARVCTCVYVCVCSRLLRVCVCVCSRPLLLVRRGFWLEGVVSSTAQGSGRGFETACVQRLVAQGLRLPACGLAPFVLPSCSLHLMMMIRDDHVQMILVTSVIIYMAMSA